MQPIHSIIHNIQPLGPLIQLPAQVLAPPLLRRPRPRVRTTTTTGTSTPPLRGRGRHHPLARRPPLPAHQQIQIRRAHILRARDPLQVADGRARREQQQRVDEGVL